MTIAGWQWWWRRRVLHEHGARGVRYAEPSGRASGFCQAPVLGADPELIDLERHLDYVLERVMTRGSWEAMQWLRATYPRESIADFLARKGDRLSPRDLAYWSLVSGHAAAPGRGGGRPPWAGP